MILSGVIRIRYGFCRGEEDYRHVGGLSGDIRFQTELQWKLPSIWTSELGFQIFFTKKGSSTNFLRKP